MTVWANRADGNILSYIKNCLNERKIAEFLIFSRKLLKCIIFKTFLQTTILYKMFSSKNSSKNSIAYTIQSYNRLNCSEMTF